MADFFATPPRSDDQLDRWRQRITRIVNQLTYSGYKTTESPRVFASSVSIVAGNLEAGTLADTETINQVYYQIGENDGGGGGARFDVQFTFTGITGRPQVLAFEGRYQGNVGHNVLLYIWNFNTTTWDRVTSDATDFPSSTSDYFLSFALPESDDYFSGGESRIRVYHSSAPAAAHNMYFDYLALRQASYFVETAGAYTDITSVSALPTVGHLVDETNGTVTVGQTGNYITRFTCCFSGDAGDVTFAIFKNGSKLMDMCSRTLTDDTQIGSASGTYADEFAAGDVLKLAITSNTSDVHISVFDLFFTIQQNPI